MKKLLLVFICFQVWAVVGQSVEKSQFTLNVLLPGVIYEHGIFKNETLTGEITMGFAYRESDFAEDGFGIYPIGRLQYRNYYNFERRRSKGKKITGNTGNYIAPTIALQGGKAVIGDLDFVSDYFGGLGTVYGLQRTGDKGLQFRFEVGPAYFLMNTMGVLGYFWLLNWALF